MPGCPGLGTEGRAAAQKGLAPAEARATRSRGHRHAGSGESPTRRRIVGSRPPALARIPSAPAQGGSRAPDAKRTRTLGLQSGPRLWFYALVLTLGFPWGCLFPMALCVSFLWASPVFLCPGHMGFPEGIIQARYTHVF